MQFGSAFALAFYAIAAAMVVGIFGFGALVYRRERLLTWRDRLAQAHMPWEQSEPPFVSYFAGAFIILLSLGFFALFVGTTVGTDSHAIDGWIGMAFFVCGALYILRGHRLAKFRRTNTAVANPRE